jgi:hypothetical protein
MSKQTPIEAKDTKITKIVTDTLKKCAYQTVGDIESAAQYIKYDRDIYYHSGLDSTKTDDKKTAVEIRRSKKDPDNGKDKDGKDKKVIVAEKIPRKAVLNFNTQLKQIFCAMFAQYVKEYVACIIECQDESNEKSLKKNHAIASLLDMAKTSSKAESYHYLPLLLTLYNEKVVNVSEDTTLIMLKASIERSKSGLGNIILDAHEDLFINLGSLKDICIESYLYFAAMFAMETATRVWVEAKIPDDGDGDGDGDDSKKKTSPIEEQSTKLISTKTIDLNAYKTFMINKMHSIGVCTKNEYDYIMIEADATVASIEEELVLDKAARQVTKEKTKADRDARATANAGKSTKTSARDNDDDAVPPGADGEDEPAKPKPKATPKATPKAKANAKPDPESDDPGSEEDAEAEAEAEAEAKPPTRTRLGNNRGGR